MDRRHVLIIIRHWWWLFLLAALSAGIATYLISVRQPAVYQATVRLTVGPGIDSPSPDLNDLRAGGQLMQTYAELPETGPFLQAVIDELNMSVAPATLAESIDVQANSDTQILSIAVRAASATDAVRIANTVAENLVRISPSGTSTPAALLNRRMQDQADQLATSISDMEERVDRLETSLARATDVDQQQTISTQLTQERERLLEAHSTLAVLLESIQQAATNQVKIIEPAATAEPVLSMLWLKVVLGLASGFIASVGLVLGFEYMTDTVDTTDDLVQSSDVPVLGAIARYPNLQGSGPERLVVEALPDSPAAENYRMLGIKLLFAGQEQSQTPVRSILLSSLAPNHDVGEIAANFAAVLAQTGSRVVLIDANLYRPTIGQHFGVVNRCGLTDVLTGECKTADLTVIDWAPGLSILPSGSVTYNSFVLLASPHMVDVLNELEERADIVLIAASPLTLFADSLFLASRVDGTILLARSGQTRRRTVREAVQSLRSVGAPILGTILHDSRRGRVLQSLSPRAGATDGHSRRRPQEADGSDADGAGTGKDGNLLAHPPDAFGEGPYEQSRFN